MELYFGRIRTRLGVTDSSYRFKFFGWFFDFFPFNLLFAPSH